MADDNVALTAIIKPMVEDARTWRDGRAKAYQRALDYYNGDLKSEIPFEADRSRVISRDMRTIVRKVTPAIARTILGNDKIVEFSPSGEGDEAIAEQQTEFMNRIVLPESDAPTAIREGIFDAQIGGDAVWMAYVEDEAEVKVTTHTGLDDLSFSLLVSGDGVEVLEHTETDTVGADGAPAKLHDVKIKRIEREKEVKGKCVPVGEFLKDSESTTIEDARLTGIVTQETRSTLVSMGYDKALVDMVPRSGEAVDGADRVTDPLSQSVNKANEVVDYYELYVRVDDDGDGYAELRRVVYLGAIDARWMVENEYWDEAPFSVSVMEPKAHEFGGVSLLDDVEMLTKVRTVLLRQMLDNLYWRNNPQPIFRSRDLLDLQSAMAPKFGQPIILSDGATQDPIKWNVIPDVASSSFQHLSYFDKELEDLTGVGEHAAGLPPDALQNVTAKASAMMEQAGVIQIDDRVRNFAEGLKKFFRQLLKLTIQHQDKPRTVRLTDQWVEFDPRTWNAEMDVTVNTGLGAGTRERDMMMMTHVTTMQERLIAAMGEDCPFVKPDNVWNSLIGMVQATGLKDAGRFFTKPNEQDFAAWKQARANRPNPEMIKAQAAQQLEQVKAQAQAMKEKAQADADIATKMKTAEIEAQLEQMRAMLQSQSRDSELSLRQYEIDQKLAVEREKLYRQHEINLLKIDQQNAKAADAAIARDWGASQ